MKSVVLFGVVVMAFRKAFVTLRVTVVVMFPIAAVMVVVPAPTDVASPEVIPTLLMVATDPSEELQATKLVMSWVVVSL